MEGLLRLLMIGHRSLGFDFPEGLACLSLGGRCHFPLKCLVDHFFTFSPSPRKPGIHSRPRKSAQDDKWNFCLTTAIIAANRRDHEQTTAPEPHTGLQG